MQARFRLFRFGIACMAAVPWRATRLGGETMGARSHLSDCSLLSHSLQCSVTPGCHVAPFLAGAAGSKEELVSLLRKEKNGDNGEGKETPVILWGHY